MTRFLLSIILSCFFFTVGQAQKITVSEDPAVKEIMETYISINKSKPYVKGWRVQILSTVDRQEFESVRSSFKARYPYLTTSWVHNRPYYKLRAGAFANKLDALRLQYLLREDYPGAYPAVDNEILAEEIIGNQGEDDD